MNLSQQKTLKTFLSQLGLSAKEVDIYLTLLDKGEMTILGLSRETKIERTKLYRMTEELIQKGIIELRIDYNKKFLTASSPSRIELMTNEYISNASMLRFLPDFLNIANNLKDSTSPTSVKFYRGKEGIKQILWNELSAKKLIYSYSYRDLQEIVGSKFFAKWAREFEMKKLTVYDLRSREFTESVKSNKSNPFKGDIKKFIDPEMLDIITQIDIYDNTMVVYNWHQGDVFGVEIINDKLAKMQQQIFKVFWEMGTKWKRQ